MRRCFAALALGSTLLLSHPWPAGAHEKPAPSAGAAAQARLSLPPKLGMAVMAKMAKVAARFPRTAKFLSNADGRAALRGSAHDFLRAAGLKDEQVAELGAAMGTLVTLAKADLASPDSSVKREVLPFFIGVGEVVRMIGLDAALRETGKRLAAMGGDPVVEKFIQKIDAITSNPEAQARFSAQVGASVASDPALGGAAMTIIFGGLNPRGLMGLLNPALGRNAHKMGRQALADLGMTPEEVDHIEAKLRAAGEPLAAVIARVIPPGELYGPVGQKIAGLKAQGQKAMDALTSIVLAVGVEHPEANKAIQTLRKNMGNPAVRAGALRALLSSPGVQELSKAVEQDSKEGKSKIRVRFAWTKE